MISIRCYYLVSDFLPYIFWRLTFMKWIPGPGLLYLYLVNLILLHALAFDLLLWQWRYTQPWIYNLFVVTKKPLAPAWWKLRRFGRRRVSTGIEQPDSWYRRWQQNRKNAIEQFNKIKVFLFVKILIFMYFWHKILNKYYTKSTIKVKISKKKKFQYIFQADFYN